MSKALDKWWCRSCRKVAYGSASRARRAIATIESLPENGPTSHIPKRTYPCPYRKGAWHLTSTPERENA